MASSSATSPARRSRACSAELGPGRPATTGGTLLAVPDPRGCYPVLLPGAGCVHGTAWERGNVDLAALDAFEGPEYRRSAVTITLADGAAAEAEAEAYRYLFPPRHDFVPIPHGDFARWLRETGHRALAG